MKRIILTFAIFLASGLFSQASYAGGVWVPVRGVRALSMGGAFVAGAEEANALWYNPARIDESSVTLDLGGVFMGGSYTNPEGLTATNQGRVLPNPTLGAVWKVHDTISIGLGVYAPYSPQHRFDEDGPQRYAMVESDQTTKMYINLAAAFRLGPVRIGAGIQNVNFRLIQRSRLSGYTGLFGEPTDPSLDAMTEIDLHEQVSLTGNFGLSADAGPVTFGASVQLPYTVSGQANLRVRLGDSPFYDSVTVDGNKADLAVPFPWIVRAGVLWRATDDLKMELSMNWEDWSVQDELTIRPIDMVLRDVPGIGDYEMGPMSIDRRMRDTLSVHLGTDYGIIDDLHLRGGVFFESSAFPDETFSVAQLDGDKLGFALGASYQVDAFRFDAAVSYIHQLSRTVTNSELRQLNPTNPDQTEIIGNGTYDSRLWVAGVGAVWFLPI